MNLPQTHSQTFLEKKKRNQINIFFVNFQAPNSLDVVIEKFKNVCGRNSYSLLKWVFEYKESIARFVIAVFRNMCARNPSSNLHSNSCDKDIHRQFCHSSVCESVWEESIVHFYIGIRVHAESIADFVMEVYSDHRHKFAFEFV